MCSQSPHRDVTVPRGYLRFKKWHGVKAQVPSPCMPNPHQEQVPMCLGIKFHPGLHRILFVTDLTESDKDYVWVIEPADGSPQE